MDNEQQGKHILVSGVVQGVGFRYWTDRVARRLKLKGWVRNLADGRVEIVVLGPEQVVKEFEQILHEGPPKSRVEAVSSQSLERHGGLEEFKIEETGESPCFGS